MIDYVLLAAFIIGLAAGGYLVARSPAFWVGLFMVILQRAWPFLSKPLSPEDRERWNQSIRRAEEWDPFRKRPREK